MDSSAGTFDFSAMPLHDRVVLAQQLLSSIQQETAAAGLTPAQISELERRIDAYDRGVVKALSWDEVKNNLRRRRHNASHN